MAKFFGDLSYAETRPMYVGQPVEEIKALQEKSDKTYEENIANKDLLDIALSNAVVNEKDAPYKKAAIKRFKESIGRVAANGDWETASPLVRKAAKEYATDRGLQLALDIPKQQAAYEAAQKARFDKGEISKEFLDNSVAMSRGSYKGIQKNPTTGEYEGSYGGYNPAKTIDPTKIANDLAKDWAADKFGKKISYAALDKSGQWIIKGMDGKTIESVNSAEVSKYIGQALADNPEVKDHFGTVAAFHNYKNKNRQLSYDDNGIPLEYAGDTYKNNKGEVKNNYQEFRNNYIREMIRTEGYPPDNENDIANAYDNEKTFNRGIGRAAGFAGAKYGYVKSEMESGNTDMNANPYELERQKADKEGGITVFNQSSLVPGDKFNANDVVKNQEEATKQIASIDAQIKAGTGNAAELNNQKTFLVHQKDVASSTLKNVVSNYVSSPEGKEELRKISKFLGKNITEDDIKNTPVPDFWDKLESFGNLRRGQGDVIQEFRENASKYAQKNPISYSANVLKGGKAIEGINKEMTDRVVENGTNYVVEGGQQLSSFLADTDNMPEGGKIAVAVTDGKFGNKYGHYMTISDKEGRKIREVPIYPVNGDSEMDYIGRKLMEENAGQKDEQQATLFNKGLNLRAERKFPTLGKDIEQQLADVTELSTTGKRASTDTTIDLDGKKYNVTLIKSRDAEDTGGGGKGVNTNYRLYVKTDKGLGDVLVEARNLTDLKAELYKLTNAQ